MTYEQIEDGKLYCYSEMTKLQCCDCGLVHTVIFELDGFRLTRDNRATGQVRRPRKKNEIQLDLNRRFIDNIYRIH